MARAQTVYICQTCGHRHHKWVGKCEGCGAWNTLSEDIISTSKASPSALNARSVDYVDLSHVQPDLTRWPTHIDELDRVCGGGLVPGSAILIGGDPGIGKSTILIQALAYLTKDRPVAYFSGEESTDQIQRRAHRLGLQNTPVQLASETNVSNILATLEKDTHTQVVVIDSIQTLFHESLESAIGTVSQVRLCAQLLIQLAKRKNVVMILVGHVTKEGTLAGPKVLEHMVDTVLYFEGEKGHAYRLLRTVKNRFGPCHEIGVFEMSEAGMTGVSNPSLLFMGERTAAVTGTTIYASLEGTRPLLVEVQALVSPCPYGTPRRAVVGWDTARLNMILAVLETRCGISFSNKDVYLNIAGGLKILEPGVDLAAAASLVSALSEVPTPTESVFCGEIALSGDVRTVNALDIRLKEAARLGLKKAYVPQLRSKNSLKIDNFDFFHVNHVHDLLPLFVTSRHQVELKKE